MKILVVDDEKLLVKGIKFNLEQDGYAVVTAFDGEEAIRLAHDESIDLILLDLMLPKVDGFTVCRTIRSFSNVPIIMVTAKSEDIDKILGLEYGADDYITKPFNIREVTARIKAILRRVNPAPKGERDKLIISGDITLDYNFRRVVINDKVIELTSKEFDLLELFMRNPGKVYTRENLLDIAWGFDYPGDVRTVDAIIRRIKEKIKNITNSMRFTMIATYLAIIVTTLVLMSIYIISLLSENLYSTETINMFAKANIISETIADVWGSDTSATSAQKFSDVVERSLAGTNIRGVVTNKSYSVLYDTNEESQLIGKVFMRDVLKRALDGEQADIITTGENNMRLISVAVPVTFGGEIIGSVYLAESINTIDDTVRTTRNSLIVFSTLIVILIGMLSLGMSYIITSPIEEFIAVAKEISKGNFSKHVEVKGHNEIAQMAQMLNYMCDELELLEEKRRKFVSDASHELKTPMAGIKLICDSLVAAENPDPAMVKEFLGDMSDEVDRLTRIVERLLVLTKLDAGGNSLKLEEVDIKMLISQVVKKLTPIANAKDIVIYVDNHQTEFSPILLDYDKMYEAIYNIADNAIKYSPEGGFVHIDLTADNDYLTIKIEDNGPGIPEDERDRIFERFYRLDDSRARDTGGTGLGLAITKEAVLMHNGTIDVANVSDIGSVFTIRLPYKITIGGQNEK